ncbi:alpha/beta hydrolase [Parasphingorhabdus sp.]|uniref:alpha/beta fold hydrolase n=1 Tax=Parasphingorhabdus sp. TaxID=2709688 RepID=UPI003263B047
MTGTSSLSAAALLGMTSKTSAKSPRTTERAAIQNFVLVHGAWHGGWCWRDVTSGLRAKGHNVFTPTLTGLGERSHLLTPEVGLQTHIDDILSVIRFNDLEDVILIGHSYGGMVITGVADALREKLQHVVYLDAALPHDGETMISQGPVRAPEALKAAENQLRTLAPDGIGMNTFPPEFLGIPKDHPGHDWVARHMTPHPLKTWFDPIKLKNGGSDGLARTYIHCNDPVLPGTSFAFHSARTGSDPSWNSLTLATGHDAMVTRPGELSEILLSL